MSEDLARDLQDKYTNEVENFNENLNDILKQGFGMKAEEVFVFLT